MKSTLSPPDPRENVVLQSPQRLDSSALRLGAILAGGRSQRFGSPKQVAKLGGAPLLERMAHIVRSAGAHPVVIAAPGSRDFGDVIPSRADTVPDVGPLGGVHAAILWARELGLPGTLCVACDTPFLPPALLRQIAEVGEITPGFAVAPESGGRREVEPLCAWYPLAALGEVEARLADSRRSLLGLLEAIPLRRIPLAEVLPHGDPATIFLNINTPADLGRAAAIQVRRDPADVAI